LSYMAHYQTCPYQRAGFDLAYYPALLVKTLSHGKRWRQQSNSPKTWKSDYTTHALYMNVNDLLRSATSLGNTFRVFQRVKNDWFGPWSFEILHWKPDLNEKCWKLIWNSCPNLNRLFLKQNTGKLATRYSPARTLADSLRTLWTVGRAILWAS
jgi:hypothetical protein